MSDRRKYRSGDDSFERVAPNGIPATQNAEVGRKQPNLRFCTPQFEARVLDAMARIRVGDTRDEVRETHGIIVLRQALADMRKGRGDE